MLAERARRGHDASPRLRRGAAAAHCSECTNCSGGSNTIDPSTGANAWVAGNTSNASYLMLNDAVKAGAALDALLVQPPQRRAPTLI